MHYYPFLLFCFVCRFGHTDNPAILRQVPDEKYFDFWEGTWMLVDENNKLDSSFYFVIKKSVNPSSFIEEWYQGKWGKSIAIRSWDKSEAKWGFVWVSDGGLYQVWDSKKAGSDWYIYRHFTINGDTYLSQQGFIPQKDGSAIRISEKTYDQKKWELRFKQKLVKIT